MIGYIVAPSLFVLFLISGILLFLKLWIRLSAIPNSVCKKSELDFGGQKQKIQKFNVLTFNLFLRPSGVSDFKGDWKNERLDLFLEEISKFDVVCLQECFGTLGLRANHLAKIAAEKGFHYYLLPTPLRWASVKVIDSGLAVLSRYPLTDVEWLEFKDGAYVDHWLQKGVFYAKLHLSEGVHAHLFNTHIQSDYALIDSVADKVKLSQLDEMVALVERKTSDGAPIIVCGDFNVDCDHPLALKSADHGSEVVGKSLYDEMLSRLHLRHRQQPLYDLLAEQCIRGGISQRPPTNYSCYDTKGREVDTLYRSAEELAKLNLVRLPRSVDYICFSPAASNFNKYELRVEDTKVETFPVDDQPFNNISDHFGVVSTFVVHRK